MVARSEQWRSGSGSVFRRVLHGYFLMSRSLTIGVRAVVRSENGAFLLVRHTYTSGWHFPGGGVERGGTVEAALGLELEQETGLRLSGRPVLHGVFHNERVNPRDHVLVFLCEATGSLSRASSGLEIAELGYFASDALPEGTDAGTRCRIREIVDGTPLSSTW